MHDPTFLESADRIGARLCRDAVWSEQRCNWLGWALDAVGNAWSPVYKAQTANLYDGTAGIALFLGRLYLFTEDPMQKETALAALNQAISAAEEIAPGLRPSVYSGSLGIAYATIELGIAFDDERMVARGLRDLRLAAEIPHGEGWLDILGGTAGAVQALLATARRFDERDLIERAEVHGSRLLATAVRSENGWSWDTLPGQTEKHLCGYGHGAAGISCALLELWAETGEAKYLEAALEGFRYERSHFSAERHNWPDLRSMAGYGVPTNQPVFALAWCHGAPGIGLSRLRALELLEDAEIAHDLEEALQTTASACSNVSFPGSGSMCLCHGLGGNADLLLAASDVRGRSELREIAERIGRQANAQLRADDLPWPCGVNGAGETPNLMLGLAGIGHFYLRLYDSLRVPSILLLHPGTTTETWHAANENFTGAAVPVHP